MERSSQSEVPLVGRQRELAVLRAAVSRAADGRPGAVLVAGEAGGGKSRLGPALLEEETRTPFLVLQAQCVDLGDPGLPYLTLVDLVRAVTGARPEVASVLDRFPLVSRLADPNGAGETPVDETRRLQLFDATAALLAEVGRVRGPVVLTIEDLQWMDASSADFIRFLLSRMNTERLVVVATVRTDGLAARPQARHLLGELARLPSVQRLDLEPFDSSEVAEYLSRVDADPEVAAEVFRRTRGNPYYVETLVAGLKRTGAVDEEIPRGLTDLLVGRLDGLPHEARTVVRAAAAAASPVPDRLLREVVDLTDDLMDKALRAAVREGMLVPDGAGYAFAHDLVRGAVYDDLLPGERARLHASYAVVLESGTAGPVRAAEVAHHAAHAQDEPRVLEWSLRAADEAERMQAPAEALHHLERVLVLELRGPVALRAARAAGMAGEPARAAELARRAIQLCDADGDASGGVEARAELVRQLLVIDATDQAIRPAEGAVALAESGGVDTSILALAHVMLARALLSDRRPDEARPRAEQALVEARAVGDPGLEVEALTTAAFLDEVAGDREAASDRLITALQLARDEGDLAAELRAHYLLASLHYYDGDVAGSLPVLRTALGRVAESGLRWSASGLELRLLHAVALFVSGDLDGSLAATHAPESRPPDVAAARLAAVGCYAAVARGLSDAERRVAALADSWDADLQVGLVAGGCETDRLTWEGEYAAAVAMAERAQTHLDSVAGEGMYGGLWLSALALAALADEASYCRQRRDRAGEATVIQQGDPLLYRVERIVAGGHGRPGDLGPEGRAWQARAVADHARLLGEPAVEPWQRALDAFGYGHAYEQARCHWRLAEAWLAAGDRAAARSHAEAAAAASEAMRAVPLQRAVAATISRAQLSGAATVGDAVLTGREREVLALVAEGLTNREIGRRLFISEKTASVHISNLMAKLNVSSRTEAVTVAQRRGLIDLM